MQITRICTRSAGLVLRDGNITRSELICEVHSGRRMDDDRLDRKQSAPDVAFEVVHAISTPIWDGPVRNPGWAGLSDKGRRQHRSVLFRSTALPSRMLRQLLLTFLQCEEPRDAPEIWLMSGRID